MLPHYFTIIIIIVLNGNQPEYPPFRVFIQYAII